MNSSIRSVHDSPKYLQFVWVLDGANMSTVHILDYVAGNVRSLVNAIEKVGYTVQWIRNPEDVQDAEVCDQAKQELNGHDTECMQSFRATADGLNTRN